MALAQELSDTATDLLRRFGEDITLGAGTSESIVNGYMQTFTPQEINQANIRTGDIQILLSAQDIPDTPSLLEAGNLIQAGGSTWQIRDVFDNRAEGQSILLTVHCRQVKAGERVSEDRPVL